MTRFRLGVVLAAVAAAAALGMAGCTDQGAGVFGGGTPTPTTTGSPPGEATGTATPTGTASGPLADGDACALLTPQDIASASGKQVGTPVPRSIAGASICQFGDVVVTRLKSPISAARFDETVRQVASAVGGEVKPISHLGDAAAYIPTLKEICVVREPTFFCIAGFDQAQSERLAEKAITRL